MDFLERGSDYTQDTLPGGLSNTNHDEVRFGLVSNSARKIINAKVEILNTTITDLTNNDGVAELDITGLSGEYTISIKTENARHRPNPADPTIQCIDNVAGPQLAEDSDESQYVLIFRPVEIRVTLRGGLLENAVDPFRLPENALPYGYTHGRIGNRIHENFVQGDPQREIDPVLPVDLRPAWFKSNAPLIHPRNNNYTDITHIVVHTTGGPEDRFGSAINTGVGSDYCAHYYMDLNGHITKVVQDKLSSGHAGASRWAGIGGVNAYSIGIEVLNKMWLPTESQKPYREPQYIALIKFLSDLQSAYNLLSKNVVGHCDIKVKSSAYQSGVSWFYDESKKGRKLDPGQHFNWKRLEDAGIGMRPNGQADLTTAYGGFFQAYPDKSLNQGDADQNRKFGGQIRGSEVSGNPIEDLQNDLEHIGYSLGPRNQTTGLRPNVGKFDDHTKRAVERFQLHFLSGDRTHSMHDPQSAPEGRNSRYLGKVDTTTAKLIKQVLGGNP
jgi:N-acetyl-anhydromuramyl-L-alanine amidase AmpD